jgi:drug/metabolite transporter (DMT)-like permease
LDFSYASHGGRGAFSHKHHHSNRSSPTSFRRAIKVSFESDDPNSVSLLNPTAQSQYGSRLTQEHSRLAAPRVSHVFAFCFFSHLPIATLQIATVSEIAKISSVLFVLWFLANLAFNVSLECTSVAANTVLSSSRYVACCPFNSKSASLQLTFLLCSSVWTLVLGHFFFDTPISRRSIGACIFCVGGIVLVVGFDSGELKGNLLAIAGAVLYSAYSLVLRAKNPNNVDISMSMMFGFVGQLPGFSHSKTSFLYRITLDVTGLFSFIVFGAVLPILHFSHVEVCIMLRV